MGRPRRHSTQQSCQHPVTIEVAFEFHKPCVGIPRMETELDVPSFEVLQVPIVAPMRHGTCPPTVTYKVQSLTSLVQAEMEKGICKVSNAFSVQVTCLILITQSFRNSHQPWGYSITTGVALYSTAAFSTPRIIN